MRKDEAELRKAIEFDDETHERKDILPVGDVVVVVVVVTDINSWLQFTPPSVIIIIEVS